MVHNKIKKLLATGMMAAMIAGMSFTSLAAGDPSKEVTGTYSAGGGGGTVYKYGYSFGSMKFNYSDGSKGTWDPDTHTYDGVATGGRWSCAEGADEIEVMNHSNAPVRVTLTFDSAKSGIKFGFGEPMFTLESAEGTVVSAAPSKTTHVGPMDDCAGLFTGDTDVTLGTVTIHVTGA